MFIGIKAPVGELRLMLVQIIVCPAAKELNHEGSGVLRRVVDVP